MASMRDIKRRRSSIQGTQQITKAMKLVSTVKLQRARAGAEQSKSYFSCMFDTVNSILQRVGHIEHPYLVPGKSDKKAVIVITSNRGLAGGYNSNVEKIVEAPAYTDAMALTSELLADFSAGKIGEIYLAYTAFKNTVSHVPTLLRLLPVEVPEKEEETKKEAAEAIMNFEPEETEALEMIIPKYMASLIYGALVEAAASENGARMQAMDNATSNAEEMITDLALKYNRARQGSITQELTEIIAGAEALG